MIRCMALVLAFCTATGAAQAQHLLPCPSEGVIWFSCTDTNTTSSCAHPPGWNTMCYGPDGRIGFSPDAKRNKVEEASNICEKHIEIAYQSEWKILCQTIENWKRDNHATQAERERKDQEKHDIDIVREAAKLIREPQ